MKKLEGKVAVVTGASKGIGASIAEHLAAEGASVVVNYASSRAGAEAVAWCHSAYSPIGGAETRDPVSTGDDTDGKGSPHSYDF